MTRRSTGRSGVAVLGAAIGLALIAAGCGIPTEATARPIDRQALPEPLISQATTTTAPSNPGSLDRSADLFLVSSAGDTESLSPIRTDILNVVDQAELPRRVIEQLIAQQPKENSSGRDLTNAIPSTAQVLNATVDGDVLELDLSDLDKVELSRQRLAAAQIVFTATALKNIRGVRFSINGEPAAVPLDDHAADVGQVVTRSDYPSLTDF